MVSSLSSENLARVSAANPWRVILIWVIILVVAGGLAGTLFLGTVTTEIKFLGNPESEQARKLLEELRGPKAVTDVAMVRSAEATVEDPGYKSTVEELVGQITALGESVVIAAPSYYATEDESQVSQDRRSTIVPIVLAGSATEAEEHVDKVHEVIDRVAVPEGFEVFITGEATLSREFTVGAERDLQKGEAIGIPVALVILAVVFGAVVAAVIPIILAIVAIVVAIGLVALVGQVIEMSLFVQNMITMIGLAVGIDYSLFIVSRYREERAKDVPIPEAIATAGATASRAVFFSGLTVILALAGLLIIPMNIFVSLGMGAITVVVSAVAAGLTLLPAVLSVMGDRVDRLEIWIPLLRKRCRGTKCADEDHEEWHYNYWDRFSRAVMRVPILSLVVSVGILLAASVSYFDINTGSSGVSTLPKDYRAYHGFVALQEEFGVGGNNPAEIVISGHNLTTKPVQDGIGRLVAALEGDDAFATPAPLEINEANNIAVLSVPVVGDITSDDTVTAVRRLRSKYIPDAFRGNVTLAKPGESRGAAVVTAVEVVVGGETAEAIDYFDLAANYQPWVIAFVLSLSLVLLLVAFRTIVVPIAAIIMNLLSVGAAYGVLVLVFQKGVGNEIFGFPQTETIEAFMPLMLFAILFGLSMDYQVFLLSRIQEQFNKTGDNAESVIYGVRSTAGLITGAALIMVAVFGGFALGELVGLMQFGFGLAVAILVDATLVRTVLMPSVLKLLGDWCWYLPPSLEWLPDFRVEGGRPTPEPTPAGGD